MSTSPAPRDDRNPSVPGPSAPDPAEPDLLVVDGTATSSEELRAEIEWLSDERNEQIETTRAELRDTLDELNTRISGRLRSRRAHFVATLRKRSAQAAGIAAVVLGVAGTVILVRRRR
jgi:ElaB/YqjD/DUF883 family membrane-anchored ribosome-binding protein